MKTLKVMSVIGIIVFSIDILYNITLSINVHNGGVAYGLALSIVGVVQANRLIKKHKETT